MWWWVTDRWCCQRCIPESEGCSYSQQVMDMHLVENMRSLDRVLILQTCLKRRNILRVWKLERWMLARIFSWFKKKSFVCCAVHQRIFWIFDGNEICARSIIKRKNLRCEVVFSLCVYGRCKTCGSIVCTPIGSGVLLEGYILVECGQYFIEGSGI